MTTSLFWRVARIYAEAIFGWEFLFSLKMSCDACQAMMKRMLQIKEKGSASCWHTKSNHNESTEQSGNQQTLEIVHREIWK